MWYKVQSCWHLRSKKLLTGRGPRLNALSTFNFEKLKRKGAWGRWRNSCIQRAVKLKPDEIFLVSPSIWPVKKPLEIMNYYPLLRNTLYLLLYLAIATHRAPLEWNINREGEGRPPRPFSFKKERSRRRGQQRRTYWLRNVRRSLSMGKGVQSWKNFSVRGLVKFVPAVAYHFCLSLSATFSQPWTNKFSRLCTPVVSTASFRPL